GYYALYLSLKEPFVPMYGAGNSMFLTREAERFLDLPGFSQRSYPARIEKYGWSVNQLWCSIYPWIASDISFPGVIVFVFLVGHFFALAWLDTLMANPFALLAFTNFLIMLIYFSGNNQMMQSGEGGVAFWVLLFAWLLTRTPIMNRRGLVDGRSGAE
ncbi:MAG: hypothetical protein LAP21_19650, partial [Acidobacteriia bacterium]|nr:hypothetical protein [Terriglobia bacterium]